MFCPLNKVRINKYVSAVIGAQNEEEVEEDARAAGGVSSEIFAKRFSSFIWKISQIQHLPLSFRETINENVLHYIFIETFRLVIID